MSEQVFVSVCDIAKILQVDKTRLGRALPFLEGFPPMQQFGKNRRYHLPTVLRWAKNRDVAEAVRDALIIERNGGSDAKIAQFNRLCTQFTRGDFSGPEQRQQIALKKMAARYCPKPDRQRIKLIPDWMKD